MGSKKIKFEGKIKIEDEFNAKALLGLLKFLSEELEFSIKKLESDEIKMVKNEFVNEQDGDIEITKSKIKVEVEIEVSEDEIEVEIESEDPDLVKEITNQVASRL